MSLDAVVQRGTSIARVANTRCPSMYRRVCVERAFAAERKRYPPRASQRVFTTRRCQSAALLGVHSQPHRWLKLVISVYYSSNTSLIEREYDDTCDSCCVSVGLPLSSSFYSFTRTTTTPSFQRRRRENNHTAEDDTLFMHFLFYSPSSSSVARHVPSRFRIIGFQFARLFSRFLFL